MADEVDPSTGMTYRALGFSDRAAMLAAHAAVRALHPGQPPAPPPPPAERAPRRAAPPGTPCCSCLPPADPATLCLCTCPQPHYLCAGCCASAMGATLDSNSLRCPLAPRLPPPPPALRGTAAPPSGDCILLGDTLQALLLPQAGEGAGAGAQAPLLTRQHEVRFQTLEAVLAARQSGSVAHCCPRAACPGIAVDRGDGRTGGAGANEQRLRGGLVGADGLASGRGA